MKQAEIILILDFGSQYTHLIKSSFSQIGIKSTVAPADLALNTFKTKFIDYEIKGLVLSGGAFSVNENKIPFDKEWLSLGVPILGICYGHQLLASIFGGKVTKTNGEYSNETILLDTTIPLFSKIKSKSTAWMSHKESVLKLPKGFSSIASTKDYKNAGICNSAKNIYGLQFHPEVSHTVGGLKILENFAIKICGATKNARWSPDSFMQETAQKYIRAIKDKKVIVGLSGGVDSSTLVIALRSFLPKKQILAVFIDSGLEKSTTKNEVKQLCKDFDIILKVNDSSDLFFKELKGVTDPNEKRLIVGKAFIKEFEKIATDNNAEIFAQGTIWSDVIESGVTKYSSVIKPHHNVGGLPKKMSFELIEPFRELFKDQVRSLASFLQLPDSIVNKEVFPGPGFAIRVDGEVTREKVAIVRKSTEIIKDVLSKNGLDKTGVMAFAIYINVKSSGIKGDMRFTNEYAIVVRVVETKNLLTANFSKKIFPYLEEISNRITKDTSTGKVLYDITNKPPSTIDWQ
ncbi:MAG: glutamine-hydrolyzing GMP synthase [Candidatus Levybacteria bacterium CG10_big_fil_rev_8_21_14_0_10_35_13]|nr:MAG: glutamine-hydrolyzing GMP synthase [Candidatus Levybacteria bacterium CG10_big_fil_rev_8_21_14_0_10_35_13]